MIIPKLPMYLTSLGGAEYKGMIISLFTVTAMISRPFSGKIADKVGRIPVMVIGSAVCFVVSLLYPILTSVAGFLFLRLVHGFSTGFNPTGLTAYLSDIVPAHKRGEAMGLLSTAGMVGMSAGLSVGPGIANDFGLNVMFYCSSALAIISVLILFGIKETLVHKQGFSTQVFKIHKRDLLEPRVLITCIVMVLSTYSYGAVFTVIPDFCEYIGIENEGLPFTCLTIASLSIRLIAGKASDRFGRRTVLMVSTSLILIAMTLLGMSVTQLDVLIAISIYGLAQGMTSPTLFAWAADLSDEKHRGKAISSVYIFMEMGIGIGAFLSGFIYGNDSANFFVTFLTAGLLAGTGLLYLIFTKYTGRPRHPHPVPEVEQIP
jgi:MFS family permease